MPGEKLAGERLVQVEAEKKRADEEKQIARAAKEMAPDRIEQSFPKQPLVQAEILNAVGTTYRNIGELGQAIDFLKRAEALCRQLYGPEHPLTLRSMNNLATTYRSAGQVDLALPLLKETFQLTQAKYGPNHLLAG